MGVQSGLRVERSTVEYTMAIRYIFDLCRVSKRMTTIIFVDFNKAFESIDRRAISIVLSKHGVSELLITNIVQFYISPHDAFAMSANRRVRRQMFLAALGITWPETISTAELTQRAKLIPLSRTICKRRLRLVGHVIRMQSRCQAPICALLTTVPSYCHIRQDYGRTSTLQRNVVDDIRSINCDVTSISGMTKSCFFNLTH